MESEMNGLQSNLYRLTVIILAHLKDKYNQGLKKYDLSSQVFNENTFVSLGALSSLSLSLLLLRLFLLSIPVAPHLLTPRLRTLLDHPIIQQLSLYTLFSILLSTIGGFCVFIALLYPQMRAYNRISIFL
jgi:hypothetical protein